MVIVDASAAVEIARETETGKAMAALIREDEEILAPDLYLLETANAFWKYVRAGVMDYASARSRYKAARDLPNRFVRMNDLAAEVFAESCRLSHPVYDVAYFVLARRMDAKMVTADKRLIKLCQEHGIDHFAPVTL